jgi:hypothetical protein
MTDKILSMKSKPLNIAFFIIFMIAAITLLLFYFDMKVGGVVVIIAYGLVLGILVAIFNGYFIPGMWIRMRRFLLQGMLIGLAFFVFALLDTIVDGKDLHVMLLLKMLIASMCVGVIIGYGFLKWNYRVIKNQTILELLEGEVLILDDSATLLNEDSIGRGRLMLTSMRLVFAYLDIEKENFIVNADALKSGVELNARFGIPNGIRIAEADTQFTVKYPGLWKREIENCFSKL